MGLLKSLIPITSLWKILTSFRNFFYVQSYLLHPCQTACGLFIREAITGQKLEKHLHAKLQETYSKQEGKKENQFQLKLPIIPIGEGDTSDGIQLKKGFTVYFHIQKITLI